MGALDSITQALQSGAKTASQTPALQSTPVSYSANIVPPSGPGPLAALSSGIQSGAGSAFNIPSTAWFSPQSFGGNGSTGLGAGQGPGTQSTGQSSDKPFNNSFFFQIPQAGAQASGPSATPQTTGGGGGYVQYLPLIVVGVVVAGLGYYLFEKKRK